MAANPIRTPVRNRLDKPSRKRQPIGRICKRGLRGLRWTAGSRSVPTGNCDSDEDEEYENPNGSEEKQGQSNHFDCCKIRNPANSHNDLTLSLGELGLVSCHRYNIGGTLKGGGIDCRIVSVPTVRQAREAPTRGRG